MSWMSEHATRSNTTISMPHNNLNARGPPFGARARLANHSPHTCRPDSLYVATHEAATAETLRQAWEHAFATK